MFDDIKTFTPAQLKKAAALRDLAEKKLQTMEYGNVTLKKVKNLSHSDVEDIHDAMAQLVQTGEDPYIGRIGPSSELKQVYINAGVFSAN